MLVFDPNDGHRALAGIPNHNNRKKNATLGIASFVFVVNYLNGELEFEFWLPATNLIHSDTPSSSLSFLSLSPFALFAMVSGSFPLLTLAAYDHVFDEYSSSYEVFERTTKPLVDELIDGYNCTCFAYGATGAGKTFTMIGSEVLSFLLC